MQRAMPPSSGEIYHEVVAVELHIGHDFHERLDHLIGGSHIVKAGKWDRVVDSRVMRVKRNDVGNAHGNQFLKHESAVQRFAGASLMLSALVEHRHDDG